MLSNFVLGVCECAGDMENGCILLSIHILKEIREKVGDGKVLSSICPVVWILL